jgi:antitoxin ParD1/3/4
MPTRNVSLTPELDAQVAERVASGRYENASEVFRAALRALEQQEQVDTVKLRQLEKDLDEGENSGDFEGDPFEAAYAELGWRPEHAKKSRKRG